MREHEKRIAGEAAVRFIENGMLIGLGTGSTVIYFLQALSEKIKQDNMEVHGVPTSKLTTTICYSLGIKLLDIHSVNALDLTVDGADEVNQQFQMIKGGGGALLREKIIAEISKKVIIVVDSTKVVKKLGDAQLPVEVTSFGYRKVQKQLMEYTGTVATLRFSHGHPYTTDNGHYILDCQIGWSYKPELLAAQLKAITGVVDTGLFTEHCHTLIVGKGTDVLIFHK